MAMQHCSPNLSHPLVIRFQDREPIKVGNRSKKTKATSLWQYMKSFLGKVMYTL